MHFESLLDRYFQAANKHDVSATLDHFAEDAIVHDEGKTHHGHEQIRHWLEETNASYNAHSIVLNRSFSGEKATVLVAVSGTFPGSPIQLTFNFVFANGKIKSLNFEG